MTTHQYREAANKLNEFIRWSRNERSKDLRIADLAYMAEIYRSKIKEYKSTYPYGKR